MPTASLALALTLALVQHNLSPFTLITACSGTEPNTTTTATTTTVAWQDLLLCQRLLRKGTNDGAASEQQAAAERDTTRPNTLVPLRLLHDAHTHTQPRANRPIRERERPKEREKESECAKCVHHQHVWED